MAQQCKCTLIDKLTAEQFDTSYRKPAPPVKKAPVAKPFKRTEQEQDDRDKIMFNAGRYQAGARDKAAVRSHEKFELMMSYV